MKTLSATEARQNFGNLMANIEQEPVIIQKSSRDLAVLISTKRYDELKKLEDILYGKAAQLALEEGVLSAKASQELLDSI